MRGECNIRAPESRAKEQTLEASLSLPPSLPDFFRFSSLSLPFPELYSQCADDRPSITLDLAQTVKIRFVSCEIRRERKYAAAEGKWERNLCCCIGEREGNVYGSKSLLFLPRSLCILSPHPRLKSNDASWEKKRKARFAGNSLAPQKGFDYFSSIFLHLGRPHFAPIIVSSVNSARKQLQSKELGGKEASRLERNAKKYGVRETNLLSQLGAITFRPTYRGPEMALEIALHIWDLSAR